jgi:hypothetical protein
LALRHQRISLFIPWQQRSRVPVSNCFAQREIASSARAKMNRSIIERIAQGADTQGFYRINYLVHFDHVCHPSLSSRITRADRHDVKR